jgi:hypothetical protein
MISRLLSSLAILLFALAVPLLEINATHVFNPDWPAHARLHEVWQLITNSALGGVALWWVWVRGDVRLPALLTLLVTGGFLAAYLLRSTYGGSMVHSDGSEKLVLGLSIGVVGFGAAVLLVVIAVVLDWRRSAAAVLD